MVSSVESEAGALLHNVQELEPLCTNLKEMEHTEPETPIQIDK